MDKSAGKKWPWIIGFSVIGIIVACIITIKVALRVPVEPSDYGMQNYHEYDANVNEIIEAKIAFDKLYKVELVTKALKEDNTSLSYKITSTSGEEMNSAALSVVLTRPDTRKFDIVLAQPKVEDGIYTYDSISLPKAGRWDILAKVTVGQNHRYYNLKTDTRYTWFTEF